MLAFLRSNLYSHSSNIDREKRKETAAGQGLGPELDAQGQGLEDPRSGEEKGDGSESGPGLGPGMEEKGKDVGLEGVADGDGAIAAAVVGGVQSEGQRQSQSQGQVEMADDDSSIAGETRASLTITDRILL